MKKIVINACYGGFGISKEAFELAQKLSGNPKWGNLIESEDISFLNSYHPDVPRDDKILVMVVEQLGKKANSLCSNLEIVEVSGKYRITQYDGMEYVETPDSIEWSE